MPVYTATRIHNGLHWLPEGTAIETDDNGGIIAIHEVAPAGATHYEGILCPGFVNVHCHLELSHLKGAIPQHTGLIPFLTSVPTLRNNYSEEDKANARFAALQEMQSNGIVAVGDIANATDTTDLRALDRMHFVTFVETIGFNPAFADRSMEYSVSNLGQFAEQKENVHKLAQQIVPHAPYSVSKELFALINSHDPQSILSIHNQESEEENKFYQSKTGNVLDLLSFFGIDSSQFLPSGKTSLSTYLPYLSANHPILLVHNTVSSREDIRQATASHKQLYWGLCPNANLYIENKLPDIPMMIEEGCVLCIGTDSLASNHGLSILDELRTIHHHYPAISWEQLITWATANGAKALGLSEIVGRIEPGKTPGLVHISHLNESANEISCSRII